MFRTAEKRKRQKSSWTWDYFTLNSETKMAKCNLCAFEKLHESSTSSMSHHLRISHNLNSRLSVENLNEVIYSDDEDEETPNKVQKNNNIISEKKIVNINEKLINFIIGTDQPMRLVERKEFKELLRELNPNYSLPARCTLTNEFLSNKV